MSMKGASFAEKEGAFTLQAANCYVAETERCERQLLEAVELLF